MRKKPQKISSSNAKNTALSSRAFERALEECERWGVVVVQPPPVRFVPSLAAYTEASQHKAVIDMFAGVIVWADSERDRFAAAALIHEMAHVVVWRECGQLPEQVEELGCMLALEHEACRRIGADWVGWMSQFNISTGLWTRATIKTRSSCLRLAYLDAVDRRLMLNRKPTYCQKYTFKPNEGRIATRWRNDDR